MRRLCRFIIAALTAVVGAVVLYLSAAILLGRLSVSVPPLTAERSITIYVISNGIHTDIAMPLNHPAFDWSPYADPAHTIAARRDSRYIAIGWGDKGFYLNTPTWGDLTAQTALRAVSGFNQTALHVSFYPELSENTHTAAIRISETQYRTLAANIAATFKLHNRRSQTIGGAHYHDNDAFYEAHGRYSLFKTCNTWTNQQLKQAGIGGVYWTPFAHDLIRTAKRLPE